MKVVEVFSEEELYGTGGSGEEVATGGAKRDDKDANDNIQHHNSVSTIMCDAWSVGRRRRRESSNKLQLCTRACDCNKRKEYSSSSRSNA